jgi:hypothetical protein
MRYRSGAWYFKGWSLSTMLFRARVDGAVGRMLLVHVLIIGGAFALAFTGNEKSVFLVFVLFKLLLDVGFALPLSRPLVTDAQDVSAERRRRDEEVRGS